MNHRRAPGFSPRARRAQKREGMVLLIVLLVLLMATSTATFAIQNAGLEVRAAGNMRQALRTKYVADSFVMAGLACIEGDCTAPNPAGDAWRGKYGVPSRDPATLDEIYEIDGERLMGDANFVDAQGNPAEIVPSDATLSGGTASAFVPGYTMVYERWTLRAPTNTSPTGEYRYVASCYGELALPAGSDSELAGATNRGAHESISIARAYYTHEE